MSEKKKLTRAEIVRQRRAERLKREASLAVTARVEKPKPPAPKRKKNSKKRRYEASVAAPSIPSPLSRAPKLRLPALRLPRVHLSTRWISLLLSAALLSLLYGMVRSGYFSAAPPQVSGNERISTSEIQMAMGITGTPVFLLQPDILARDLRLAMPELKSVSVKIRLPNRILVQVEERQPVLAWQENGKITWIDAEGVAFLPDGNAESLIPVLAFAPPPPTHTMPADPLSPPPYLSPELVSMLQTLASQAPAGASLFYDAQYGIGWHDPRGWVAYFGTEGQDVALKLRVYQAIVDYLAQKGVHPTMISVAYPENPFYRLEQ